MASEWEGTPIRVANVIADAMTKYLDKKATLYFNDFDAEKIDELKENLPADTNNFHIEFSTGDGNDLLKTLRPKLLRQDGLHYLLFYDPYKAAINWEALAPYFFGWGEVIINHMDSDTRRAVKSAKRPEAIDKYEQTYLTTVDDLISLHDDKNAYDGLIKDIIKKLRNMSNRGEYYLAAFPFFIKTNAKIYSIIFFTNNINGFKLFKTTAWKIFGGKSSNQNTHGEEIQQSLFATPPEDKQCYTVNDIADYIVDNFKGRSAVPLKEIYDVVDEHPVFPTDGWKPQIKDALKLTGRCKVGRSTADFA